MSVLLGLGFRMWTQSVPLVGVRAWAQLQGLILPTHPLPVVQVGDAVKDIAQRRIIGENADVSLSGFSIFNSAFDVQGFAQILEDLRDGSILLVKRHLDIQARIIRKRVLGDADHRLLLGR